MANQLTVGGQAAWFHDEGCPYGTFHTFDTLSLPDTAPRKVHVLLPRAWDRGRRYPVVYLNDGQTAFFPFDPGASLRVAQKLGELCGSGRAEEVIVVAAYPVNRELEYTHVKWAENHDGGGAAAYAAYLAGPLGAFIDANYPTSGRNAVAGASHGGLAAVYSGLAQPQRFHDVIGMSTSFWVGTEFGFQKQTGIPLRDSQLVKDFAPLLGDAKRRPRLWLDWGLKADSRARDRGREMSVLLQEDYAYELGKDLFLFEDPLGEHNEGAWEHCLGLALQTLFPLKAVLK
jgi:predicted alpha/beta superfamily hydrolase